MTHLGPDMSVEFAGIKLPNPTILASGILGVSAEIMIRASRAGAGGVVCKSFNRNGREGYRNPSFIEVPGGFLNALGIPNPGMEEMREEVRAVSKAGVPIIASVFGFDAEEFAGADGITAINTALGMAVDVDSGYPILGGILGGLSGAALHPIAVRAVYQIRRAVDIPIIGVGGIHDWRSAMEMVMAGASAVQIGSAVTNRGLEIFRDVTTGMAKFIESKGWSSIRDAVGTAAKQSEA